MLNDLCTRVTNCDIINSSWSSCNWTYDNLI